MNAVPDDRGYFGDFGGAYLPPHLEEEMAKVAAMYNTLKNDPEFLAEITEIQKHYQGRPTPVTFLRGLTARQGGAQIYVKREDLNHSGAHKLNHCAGEVLLAKRLGKTKVIAETGAGQHGVALATAAAYLGLDCEIHMGAIDIEKEHPNVIRMQLLGAKVVPVTIGQQTLKEAVDSAFETYAQEFDTALYCIGSVVGPHPFPMMVRDFQAVVGTEARQQIQDHIGRLPDAVVACVGGGSNAMGLFSGFLADEQVKLYGVEPGGRGTKLGEHAATITYGSPGIIHGFNTLLLTDEDGEIAPVYCVASGLDYPGVGPEHAYLHSINRVTYEVANDQEALDAFYTLSKSDGIIPALESAHAIAYAMRLAPTMSADQVILVNLSGRGDKDIDFVVNTYGLGNE
ncbi:MAG: tryptophan synthase subunit beta [Propionibacteriaceae bacterium]|nr:tryptophan synthase subunit beta [Propionibacteriaceae bacterium]